MSNSLPAFSAALADAAPVFPDRDATRDKTDAISGEARRKGARPAAFPESFLPGFPLWALVHAPIDTHGLFRRLDDHCLETDGPDIDRVAAMARRHGAYLSVGVTERSPASVGTLHNTNLPFDPDGAVVNKRRTLMPTWAEKLVWARGDAAGLRPARTQLGQIGILICGENTNPLARYALIAQGEQVHISTHPPVWPFRREAPPDYARWVMTRSVAHSFEAKVFNLTVAGHLDEAAIAPGLSRPGVGVMAVKRPAHGTAGEREGSHRALASSCSPRRHPGLTYNRRWPWKSAAGSRVTVTWPRICAALRSRVEVRRYGVVPGVKVTLYTAHRPP